jgi:hypothetical protein
MAMPNKMALSGSDWALVLRHAGAGKQPPLMWQIYCEAHAALDAFDHRRAVIDAGTVAELALTSLIGEKLATTDATVSQLLIDGYRMLRNRADLYKKLGGAVPIGLQHRLIVPRNAAAHVGKTFSPEESRDAVRVARELLELASPQSQLRDEPPPIRVGASP